MHAATEALLPFGFTALESEIYAFLVSESPATGYRVAQATGKPAANVYKAIQSLETKAAILVEEGATRLCRAVPYDELLGRLGKEFELNRTQAQSAFANVGAASEDERLYTLRSIQQVGQRAGQMIEEAEREILVSGWGPAIETITPVLARAAGKGVSVEILTPESIDLDGVEVTKAVGKSVRELRIVTDGSQHLLAQMEGDGISLAYWSRNPFLTGIHRRAIVAELALSHLDKQLRDDEKRSRMSRTVESAKEQLG